MFGTYRTVLAVFVVLDHFGGLPITSTPMVFGFFCLSGFLMTMLMDGTYKGRLGAFFTNRFLRLFPLYWSAIAALWWYIGAWPTFTAGFIRQLALVNLSFDAPFVIPVAWAVTTELLFYALIAFGLSKTLNRSVAWLAASVVFTVAAFGYVSVTGGDFMKSLYFPPWAGTLPFAFGAVLYHLRDRLPAKLSVGVGVLAATTALCSYAYTQLGRADLMMLGLYAALFGHAVIILALYRIKLTPRVDEIIGRFSYPIYIIHVGAFGVLTNEGMASTRSLYVFVCVLALTLALSTAALVVIDAPIQWLRGVIRSSRLHSAPVHAGNSFASMPTANSLPAAK